eukprot:804995-Pyramimonas_sp.AAC.1
MRGIRQRTRRTRKDRRRQQTKCGGSDATTRPVQTCHDGYRLPWACQLCWRTIWTDQRSNCYEGVARRYLHGWFMKKKTCRTCRREPCVRCQGRLRWTFTPRSGRSKGCQDQG